tara:strand:- start:211 stop:429 length:219 start_codon:yes stop_codon:yes gene_type:complete
VFESRIAMGSLNLVAIGRYGVQTGPAFPWTTGIRGVAGSLSVESGSVVSAALFNKYQLKSLILAQIERWRHG